MRSWIILISQESPGLRLEWAVQEGYHGDRRNLIENSKKRPQKSNGGQQKKRRKRRTEIKASYGIRKRLDSRIAAARKSRNENQVLLQRHIHLAALQTLQQKDRKGGKA
jgi:hypothetical protein